MLVEYAINIGGQDDHGWFELLLRKLLAWSPQLAIVAVTTLRLATDDEPCLSEQRLCEVYGGSVRRTPSPAEQAITALPARLA